MTDKQRPPIPDAGWDNTAPVEIIGGGVVGSQFIKQLVVEIVKQLQQL